MLDQSDRELRNPVRPFKMQFQRWGLAKSKRKEKEGAHIPTWTRQRDIHDPRLHVSSFLASTSYYIHCTRVQAIW